MKHFKLLAIAVAAALASAAAFAQTATNAPAAGDQHAQLDANKDGLIDRAEAAKAPRLAAQFDQLDKNKDGKLDAGERPQMAGKRHQGGKQGGHGRMIAADTDKDGRISRAEADAANAKASERFEQMDVNKDGYLDRSDRRRAARSAAPNASARPTPTRTASSAAPSSTGWAKPADRCAMASASGSRATTRTRVRSRPGSSRAPRPMAAARGDAGRLPASALAQHAPALAFALHLEQLRVVQVQHQVDRAAA